MNTLENAISWFEIPVSDMERAVTFYEAILDIKLISMDLGDNIEMALFPVDPETIGGALVHNTEWYHPSDSKGPLLYLNANPDLQEVQDRVEDAGGKVSIPKRLISEDHGYMAVIEDSEGNRIALHSNE